MSKSVFKLLGLLTLGKQFVMRRNEGRSFWRHIPHMNVFFPYCEPRERDWLPFKMEYLEKQKSYPSSQVGVWSRSQV